MTDKPITTSRRGKLIWLFIGISVLSFWLYMTYYQKNMYNDTIANGREIRTPIIDIDCSNGKTKSRLYFRNDKGEIKHVNVSYTDCGTYNKGDSITVYANNDWYEIDPATKH